MPDLYSGFSRVVAQGSVSSSRSYISAGSQCGGAVVDFGAESRGAFVGVHVAHPLGVLGTVFGTIGVFRWVVSAFGLSAHVRGAVFGEL